MFLNKKISAEAYSVIQPLFKQTDGLLDERKLLELINLPNANAKIQQSALGPKTTSSLTNWYVNVYLKASKDNKRTPEGCETHIYLDYPTRYATVGMGHLLTKEHSKEAILTAINDLRKKGFIFKTCPGTSDKPEGKVNCPNIAALHTEVAKDKDLERAATFLAREYEQKHKTKSFNFKPSSYYNEQENYIVLDQKSIDQLTLLDTEEKIRHLEKAFPNFTKFPAGAQAALLDMSYNMGVQGLLHRFPNFVSLIKGKHNAHEPDWHAIVQPNRQGIYPFNRRDVGQARNNATLILFLLADDYANAHLQKIGG